MQSPVGSHATLDSIELDSGLEAYRCPETGGHWIPAENYWRWRSAVPGQEPAGDTKPSAPVSEYDDVVKLCPESGTLMTRYRVGHGLNFRVDRSNTGGIWLDGGEWESLRAGNLHHSLHLIFTAPWQKAVRDHARDEAYHTQLQQRLGAELYAQVDALRQELAGHPDRAAAMAFLAGS